MGQGSGMLQERSHDPHICAYSHRRRCRDGFVEEVGAFSSDFCILEEILILVLISLYFIVGY